MYLYFNKQGVLTTVIPHGEPVRQGSYLNISVCLDLDTFSREDSAKYGCRVELSFPNEKLGTHSIDLDGAEQEEFVKTDDSEITYDLVPGQDYWVYKFRFTPEQSTFNAGKVTANVSFGRYNLEQNPSEIEDVQYAGSAEIFIEKTFGFSKRVTDNSSLHYNNLVAMINELSTKKVNKQGNEILTLRRENFIEQDNGRYFTLVDNSFNDLLKNNEYQLVRIRKTNGNLETYYPVDKFIISDNPSLMSFIRFEKSSVAGMPFTIELLKFVFSNNTWYWYPDIIFAKKEDVDKKFIKLRDEINNYFDENKKIKSEFLPSFVDDIIEGYYKNGEFYYDSNYTEKVAREHGKMYIDLATNGELYRWGGNRFIKLPLNSNGQLITAPFIKINDGRYEAAYYSDAENNYVEGTTLFLSNYWSVVDKVLTNKSDILTDDEILDLD